MDIHRHGSVLPPFLILILLLVSATLAHAAGSLALSVMVDHDPIRLGEGFRVEVRVANQGDAPLQDVAVELPLSAELSSGLREGDISDGGLCSSVLSVADENPSVAKSSGLTNAGFDSCLLTGGSLTVSWNLGNLPPGASRSRFLSTHVSSIAGSITVGDRVDLNATVTAGNGEQAQAGHAMTIADDTPLNLRMRADRDPVAAGSRLGYTLNYGNSGEFDAVGVELRLGLPSGAAFVSASDGGQLLNGEVVWPLGALRAGESGRRRLVVDVDADLVSGGLLPLGDARMSGEVASTNQSMRASSLTTIGAPDALTVAVEPDSDLLHQDGGARILLAVGNTGNTPVDDVEFHLALPPGARLASSGLLETGSGAGIHTWALGTVAPGEARVLSIPIEVPEDGSLYPLPSGTLYPIDGWVTDASGAEHHADAAAAIGADGALALAIDSDRDPATSGDDLSYTLTYGNHGDAALEAAELRFPLPRDAAFVSATGGGVLLGDEVVWNLGRLPIGGGGARSVTLSVDAGLPDGALSRVTGVAIQGDSDGVSRVAHASTITPLHLASPLRLELEGPALARPGETVEFRLTVTNTSIQRQSDVRIKMLYPLGFEAFDGRALLGEDGGCVSSVSGAWPHCFSNDAFGWTVGALEPGASRTVSLTPRVQPHGVVDGMLLGLSAVAVAGDTFFSQPGRDVTAEARASLTLLIHPDRDSDADGVADVFDLDLDGDGEPNSTDNCPTVRNAAQGDANADGVGDACSTLDVDGDGNENALSDGILIVRGLLGFSGPALVDGIGPFGADPDPVDAAARIEAMRAALDIDGDGRSDALSDGILLIRYLFGFTGAALVDGAISTGATRTTPEAVASYIAGIL